MLNFVFDKIVMPIALIIGAILLFLVIALIVCGSVEIYRFSTCERITRQIAEVGGCNRYECGVRYSDGTTGDQSSPVVGETVSMCK